MRTLTMPLIDVSVKSLVLLQANPIAIKAKRMPTCWATVIRPSNMTGRNYTIKKS